MSLAEFSPTEQRVIEWLTRLNRRLSAEAVVSGQVEPENVVPFRSREARRAGRIRP